MLIYFCSDLSDLLVALSDVLIAETILGVAKGLNYTFGCRVKNIYGFSDWSPVTQIIASSVPEAPCKPSFVSATNNSITLDLYPSENH